MSLNKSSSTELFRLMLYRRPLHPELFDLQGRRCYPTAEYEVESWILPAGHVIRFQAGNQCITEAVIENGDHLPETGLIHALPCLGEKDYELTPENGLGYVTTIQTENLTDNLYAATLREMRDFAGESSALCFDWKDADGNASMSVIDCQRYKREFHLQSYHLLGGSGMVLRTQSIFEMT